MSTDNPSPVVESPTLARPVEESQGDPHAGDREAHLVTANLPDLGKPLHDGPSAVPRAAQGPRAGKRQHVRAIRGAPETQSRGLLPVQKSRLPAFVLPAVDRERANSKFPLGHADNGSGRQFLREPVEHRGQVLVNGTRPLHVAETEKNNAGQRRVARSPCWPGTSCGGRFKGINGVFGQPRGTSEGLTNIFQIELGISLDDLVSGHPVGDEIHDQSDGHPHSSNAGSTAHDIRIKSNAV